MQVIRPLEQRPGYSLSALYPSVFARLLVERALQNGVPTSACLEGSGVSANDLCGFGSVMSGRQQRRIYENVAAAIDRQGLGLDHAASMRLDHFSILGHAMRCCETVRDALVLFVKYFKTLGALVDVSLVLDGGDARLVINDVYTDRHARRLVVEETFGGVHAIVDSFLDRPATAKELRLDLESLGDSDVWRDRIGATPVTDTICSLTFSSDVLDIEIGDESLHLLRAAAEEGCALLLASLEGHASFGWRVRQTMLESSFREQTMESIASEMSVSTRTLRRRLSAEQLSFSEIRVDVLTHAATDMLRYSSATVDDIARGLGFWDTSSFRKAFKSWLGMTPTEYRATVGEVSRGTDEERTR
ncbi:AraC family transcriptional regulator ligand-binding domain-containing protein [Microbacterium sp. NPDC089695]|uniref:AraC family transcriptional regulator n=1 Tax=Microbacterium sp. NPDC089695 TaxID=3364198 RepID=UPI003821987C